MAKKGSRGRISQPPSREALEARTLLSTIAPSVRGAEFKGPPAPPRAAAASPLFIEPQAGRGPILRTIAAARSEIRLGICNLSDREVGDALSAAAARGVGVRVIVDRADYEAGPAEQGEVARLIASGVEVHLSNPVFPQSFEKVMVVDRRAVLIGTMCLVPQTFLDTRDYGVVVADRGIIREVIAVFDNDWSYSAPPGVPVAPFNPTPPVHSPYLIWGPTDAGDKLARLIRSARHSIDATSELVNDPYLEGLLVAAAGRGVRVRLITPLVPRKGPSNAPQVASLNAQGVNVRVTTDPTPPPGALPYMHAKTMVVDGRLAYLGSIDLETRETARDRELGILFRQPGAVRQLARQFQSDWQRAETPPG